MILPFILVFFKLSLHFLWLIMQKAQQNNVNAIVKIKRENGVVLWKIMVLVVKTGSIMFKNNYKLFSNLFFYVFVY